MWRRLLLDFALNITAAALIFLYFSGCVDLGSFTLDPFVGTGSLLLAAAEFGGEIEY